MRKFFYLLLVILSFTQLSCGYTTRSSLPGNIRTLYVPPFKNSINYTAQTNRSVYLPLLEVKARNAIVDQFLFDGNLKIAKSDTADLVLKGELKSYERVGLRYTENDDVQEYRVIITVSLEMWNQAEDELMWSEPSFSGEATFFIRGPQSTSEEEAANNAMIDLAKRVVERTVEDW
jgi:hypothetical protein